MVLRNLRLVEAVCGSDWAGRAGLHWPPGSAWESWCHVQLWIFTSFILGEGFVLSALLLGRTGQEGAR